VSYNTLPYPPMKGRIRIRMMMILDEGLICFYAITARAQLRGLISVDFVPDSTEIRISLVVD
jgi:hypothetical protein